MRNIVRSACLVACVLALSSCGAGDDDGGPPPDAAVPLDAPGPVDAGREPCAPNVAARGTISQLAVGAEHNCVGLGSGEIACWGRGSVSRLGRTTEGDASDAALVEGDSVDITLGCASSVSAGLHHSCVVVPGGASCWGAQLGQSGHSPTPSFTGLGELTAISAGGRFSCALRGDATVACWGTGYDGQLGDGQMHDEVVTPVSVAGLDGNATLEGVSAIDVGTNFACAVLADGRVACWGSNDTGALGASEPAKALAPVVVAGIADAVEVSAGGGFACARDTSGGVRCWGRSDLGQAGAVAASVPATAVTLPAPAVAVAAGGSHACAVTDDGAAYCWGHNAYGQLGDGDTEGSATPVRVVGSGSAATLDGVLEIGAGTMHSCARTSDRVVCWGQADFGQLGGGTSSSRPRAIDLAL